jgi:hypothetical protein
LAPKINDKESHTSRYDQFDPSKFDFSESQFSGGGRRGAIEMSIFILVKYIIFPILSRISEVRAMQSLMNPLRTLARSAKRSRPCWEHGRLARMSTAPSPALSRSPAELILPPATAAAFADKELQAIQTFTAAEERAASVELQREKVRVLAETLPEDAPELKAATAELLRQRQIVLENDTLEEATAKYRAITDSLIKLEMASSLSPMQHQIVDFYIPLVEAIDAEVSRRRRRLRCCCCCRCFVQVTSDERCLSASPVSNEVLSNLFLA